MAENGNDEKKSKDAPIKPKQWANLNDSFYF